MAKKTALSTVDNPFNPITDFDKWYKVDMEKGYNSCAYLARIARVSDSLSEQEYNEEIERAIDEIVANDLLNLYYKVTEETKEPVLDSVAS